MSRRRGSLPCWFGRWSLKRMNKEGATILLVEQSLDVALALASYVYMSIRVATCAARAQPRLCATEGRQAWYRWRLRRAQSGRFQLA